MDTHTHTHLITTCIYIDLRINHCAGKLTSEFKNLFLYEKVTPNQLGDKSGCNVERYLLAAPKPLLPDSVGTISLPD